MLDYLIPIGMAVAGIFVLMFIFQSIEKSDVGTGAIPAARKPRSKKSQRPSPKYKDDVLDLATEQLIAREVARGPLGMITDSKTVTPQTLDSIRGRRHDKDEHQHIQLHEKVNERQKQAAKEQGFKMVETPKIIPKQQQQQQQEKLQRDAEASTSIEELDRKLSSFFKNTSTRKAREVNIKEEAAVDGGVSRGYVVVKGDLSKARSW